jgi:glycerol-3-phosphate O-acyltransferase
MSERELTRTYEPNPALRAIYRRFFDKIQVDDAWVSSVRDLARRGEVVYVLRNLNFIDFFALDYLTKRYRLPQVRFVNDLGLWILNPMGKGWLNAILPARVTQRDELEDALSRGGSAALFLKRPPGVLDAVATGRAGARGLVEGDDLIRALFELSVGRERPIFLVPQVFVWSRSPDTRGSEAFDFLLGPREWPSPTRVVAQFFFNYRHVELKLGEPIDLRAFLSGANGMSESARVRRLTYTVLRRLERERRSVTGPAEKAPERVRQEIVRSPRLRGVIDDLVDERSSRYELSSRALEMLKELQATPDRTTIKGLEVVFDHVFKSVYAGVEWERADIDRLKAASREGALILLPSHKSHVDYLILSYVFNQQNLPLPLIAAGDNLNFFPVGGIFRRGGAFFIRRAFRGDRLYAAVVDAYVRRVIRDGYPIELFLEGGRSRTGKLLPPKFGLLNMVVDAALAVPERPTFFVPVSIGYEQVIEARSYEHELSGGDKAKEDAAGLLKSRDLLRHRYGRISLQIGQLLSLEEIGKELGVRTDAPLSPPKRRSLVTRLGNRVMDEINRVTAVTPGSLVALVLLTHRAGALSHVELVERAERLLAIMERLGARTSPALRTASGALSLDSLRESLQMFADTELVEVLSGPPPELGGKSRTARAGAGAYYVVPPTKRLSLDTSKNVIIHFFVERALVALAVLALPDAGLDAIRERVRALSRLFKFEFRFRADQPFEAIFEATVRGMVEAGELDDAEGRLAPRSERPGPTGRATLECYASLLASFLEGYRVAARALGHLEKGGLGEKELVKKVLSVGRDLLADGTIERPEAVSKPMIQNALPAFVDHGYLLHREGYELAPGFARPEALTAIEQTIESYLPRGLDA